MRSCLRTPPATLGIPDLGAFLDWIAAGHGFAGMHSASDTYHDEPRYLAMLGNEFLTHGEQTPSTPWSRQ